VSRSPWTPPSCRDCALRAWWFDPRTGAATDAGAAQRGPSVEFVPPERTDRVLVVDDAARGYGPPGDHPL
jgi:hypothetical protein